MVWPKQINHDKGGGSHSITGPRKSDKGKVKKTSLTPVDLQSLAQPLPMSGKAEKR